MFFLAIDFECEVGSINGEDTLLVLSSKFEYIAFLTVVMTYLSSLDSNLLPTPTVARTLSLSLDSN